MARERNAFEPSHMAVIIVAGRSVADWLLYIPEITADRKLWKESGIKTSSVFKNIVSVKGVNLRTANINIKKGKKESIRKKADCPAKAEIDALFARLYEDRVTDRITERNFSMLSDKYQTEQETLAQTIDSLQQQLAQDKQESTDAEKWIALIKQYTYPTELTAELLNALIEKILVHEAVKEENGNRVQKVEIFYRFIGRID